MLRSLCLFSGFRSPWSLSNKDDKTEKGAVSLFCGGGGKLTSVPVDAALIGVGYESWDSAEDMVAADKIHIPRARIDSGSGTRLMHVIRVMKSPDLQLFWVLDLNSSFGFSTDFTLSLQHTNYESAGGLRNCQLFCTDYGYRRTLQFPAAAEDQ